MTIRHQPGLNHLCPASGYWLLIGSYLLRSPSFIPLVPTPGRSDPLPTNPHSSSSEIYQTPQNTLFFPPLKVQFITLVRIVAFLSFFSWKTNFSLPPRRSASRTLKVTLPKKRRTTCNLLFLKAHSGGRGGVRWTDGGEKTPFPR